MEKNQKYLIPSYVKFGLTSLAFGGVAYYMVRNKKTGVKVVGVIAGLAAGALAYRSTMNYIGKIKQK